MPRTPPRVPFGAVYFRKSNPPASDWAKDYGVAAEDGLNTFRHWFMWSAIERKPGVYDWDDYDRQMDLAAENGIQTVIAEFTMAAPEWLQRKYAQHRQLKADGTPMASTLSPSVAVGGFGQGLGSAGALTLNAPEVHDAVMGFLTELVNRYRNHPALMGYDVNNEVNYHPEFDFSDPTAAAFRVWLRERYGDLDALAKVWHRYSYAEWDDIMPPANPALCRVYGLACFPARQFLRACCRQDRDDPRRRPGRHHYFARDRRCHDRDGAAWLRRLARG